MRVVKGLLPPSILNEPNNGQAVQQVPPPPEKVKRKCGRPRNPIPRHKRDSHIMAEHRRRGKIQGCFHTLKELVPRYVVESGRHSKSSVLTNAVDHCKYLHSQVEELSSNIETLKKEREALARDIGELELTNVEVGGVEVDNSTDLDKMFDNHVREQNENGRKGWATDEFFLQIAGRFFQSYKNSVAGQFSAIAFTFSVTRWAIEFLARDSLTDVCKTALKSDRRKDMPIHFRPTKNLTSLHAYPTQPPVDTRITVLSNTVGEVHAIPNHIPQNPTRSLAIQGDRINYEKEQMNRLKINEFSHHASAWYNVRSQTNHRSTSNELPSAVRHFQPISDSGTPLQRNHHEIVSHRGDHTASALHISPTGYGINYRAQTFPTHSLESNEVIMADTHPNASNSRIHPFPVPVRQVQDMATNESFTNHQHSPICAHASDQASSPACIHYPMTPTSERATFSTQMSPGHHPQHPILVLPDQPSTEDHDYPHDLSLSNRPRLDKPPPLYSAHPLNLSPNHHIQHTSGTRSSQDQSQAHFVQYANTTHDIASNSQDHAHSHATQSPEPPILIPMTQSLDLSDNHDTEVAKKLQTLSTQKALRPESPPRPSKNGSYLAWLLQTPPLSSRHLQVPEASLETSSPHVSPRAVHGYSPSPEARVPQTIDMIHREERQDVQGSRPNTPETSISAQYQNFPNYKQAYIQCQQQCDMLSRDQMYVSRDRAAHAIQTRYDPIYPTVKRPNPTHQPETGSQKRWSHMHPRKVWKYRSMLSSESRALSPFAHTQSTPAQSPRHAFSLPCSPTYHSKSSPPSPNNDSAIDLSKSATSEANTAHRPWGEITDQFNFFPQSFQDRQVDQPARTAP